MQEADLSMKATLVVWTQPLCFGEGWLVRFGGCYRVKKGVKRDRVHLEP